MLFQAGVKDGAKISIVELEAYREEQAQVQAAQEQERLVQQQQAAAVRQVQTAHALRTMHAMVTCKTAGISWLMLQSDAAAVPVPKKYPALHCLVRLHALWSPATRHGTCSAALRMRVAQ